MERHSAICCVSTSVVGNYSGHFAAACGLPILVWPPQAPYPFLCEVQTLPPQAAKSAPHTKYLRTAVGSEESRRELMHNTVQPLLRIDDLAHISGVPSRTIRFYNTQGLLPAPLMQGRVAYYNQEHLLVLNIIKEFKEQQNLPLDVIKQLLEIRAQHGDVQMNLALKQRLLRPLTSGGQDVKLLKEELIRQTGSTGEQVDELTRQGLLFPIEQDKTLLYTG